MSQHSSRGRGWERIRQDIINKYGGVCTNCNAENANHVDHIIPRAAGGSDDYSNLTLLCRECNLKKGSRIQSMRTTWQHNDWFMNNLH